MKKLVSLIVMALCVCSISIMPTIRLAKAENGRKALFIEKVGVLLQTSKSDYEIYVKFNKIVSTAEADLSSFSQSVFIDNSSVKDLMAKNSNITMKYKKINSVSASNFVLAISVPQDSNIIATEGKNKLAVKGGFTGGTADYIVTTDLVYNIGSVNKSDGFRIYRLDSSAYEDISVLALGAPSKPFKSNMTIKMYLSNDICSRKLVNMQFWYDYIFKGSSLSQYPYTESEIINLFNYGIVGVESKESLLHKIQIGSSKFNDLKYFNSTKNIESVGSIDGFEMYSAEALMRSTNTEDSTFAGETQLSIQIHMQGNNIEFSFKGDSADARYNLAPEITDEMIIKFEKGLMFPNGRMVKEDTIFQWFPTESVWKNITNGAESEEKFIDETLTNQGGFTDDELAKMKK